MRAVTLAAFAGFTLVATSARAAGTKEACIDASERAQKLVDQGRLREARTGFLACAQASCPEAVRSDCQAQFAELKKKIPSVIVRARDASGSDVAGGTVSLDGTSLGVLDGKTIDLDPGTHELALTLPDGRSFHRQIVVAAGEPTRDIAFDASARASLETPPPTAPRATQWSAVRTAGMVTTIVGGVGLGASVVFFVLTQTFQSNAVALQGRSASCPMLSPQPPDMPGNYDANCQQAISDHAQALTAQDLSLALLIGGGAVLATGLVLFIVGGNKPAPASALRVTPMVGPTFAGLGLRGAF